MEVTILGGFFFFPREGGVEAATFSLTTSHVCVGWQQMTGVVVCSGG